MQADYANSETSVNGLFRYKRTQPRHAPGYDGRMLRMRIRELREARGWKLKELSARAGISVSYLSEIEKHRKPANTHRIERLASAFGVPPQELLEDQGARDEISALVIDFSELSAEDRAVVARLAKSLRRSSDGE